MAKRRKKRKRKERRIINGKRHWKGKLYKRKKDARKKAKFWRSMPGGGARILKEKKGWRVWWR